MMEFEVGGIVNHNAVYVDRQEDEKLQGFISKNETIIINGPRMVGKSSMAAKCLGRMEIENSQLRRAWIDLRHKLPPDEEPRKGYWWFKAILKELASELNLNSRNLDEWFENALTKKALSYSEVVVYFLSEFLSDTSLIRTILVIDEMDELHKHGHYSDQFLTAIQDLYNKRHNLNLSIILIGNLPISFLIKRGQKASFKIGRRIKLHDFRPDQKTMEEWSSKLPSAIIEKKETTKYLIEQTGGIAYLMSRIFRDIWEEELYDFGGIEKNIENLIEIAPFEIEGESHFRAPKDFILESLSASTCLYAYLEIIQENRKSLVDIADSVAIGTLAASGLVRVKANMNVELRCPIYTKVFDTKWIQTMHKALVTKSETDSKKNRLQKDYTRICIINMGGTLGMINQNEKMVAPHSIDKLKEVYPFLKTIDSVAFINLDPKDGANINAKDWQRLFKEIDDRRNMNFDGFVVIHGTDTLQYTASAVAFALGPTLDFPVVFVGSQAPHTILHADAEVNLKRAVRVALEEIPEVVICFGDHVFRAVRATKTNDFDFEGFASPMSDPLAIIREKIELNKRVINDFDSNPNTNGINFQAKFDTRVLQLTQYPNLEPNVFFEIIKSKEYQGVVIESLGIGNLTTHSEKMSWLPLIENTIALNIPVIITSKYPINPKTINQYITAMTPLEKGAIHAGNMVSSTVLTKLMWLLPQIPVNKNETIIKRMDRIKKKILHSYIGEIDN